LLVQLAVMRAAPAVTAVIVCVACWAAAIVVTLSVTTAIHNSLPSAESALLWAAPNPWDASGRFTSLRHFSAAELNHLHAGDQLGPIRFVAADVASTRPDVVSVNPIDDATWGAASYSVRAHRCYLMLVVAEPGHPASTSVLFGRLPDGAACVGLAATPKQVRSQDLPPES
jgi:hypothetical protein